MITFIGADLGWYGKPTGLASICLTPGGLRLDAVTRLSDCDEMLGWIASASAESAVIGVDAPLIISNLAGRRTAESQISRDFYRFHAGCHSSNLNLPFSEHVLRFSADLQALGFRHGVGRPARAAGRQQIEVHPHAASITLFQLQRIFKYKRGRRADRASELRRYRECLLSRLPTLDPPLTLELPAIPERGDLKPVEDQIDAVLCACIAAHWWFWGTTRNRVYGSEADGYIVVPHPNGAIA